MNVETSLDIAVCFAHGLALSLQVLCHVAGGQ